MYHGAIQEIKLAFLCETRSIISLRCTCTSLRCRLEVSMTSTGRAVDELILDTASRLEVTSSAVSLVGWAWDWVILGRDDNWWRSTVGSTSTEVVWASGVFFVSSLLSAAVSAGKASSASSTCTNKGWHDSSWTTSISNISRNSSQQ